MNNKLTCIFAVLVTLTMVSLGAPITIDFESTGYSDNQELGKSLTVDGFIFEINSTDPADDILFDTSPISGSNGALKDDNLNIGGITMWTISKADDTEFQLMNLYLHEGGVGASTSGTISAFKDGFQVGSSLAINFDGLKNYTTYEDFEDIDEIRIAATDIFLYVDDLTYGDAVPEPATLALLGIAGGVLMLRRKFFLM